MSARFTTRDLLLCAASAALAALLIVLTGPLTRSLALIAPPVYALVAALPTVFFYFSARAVGRLFGAATLTALLTAVLSIPFTTLGLLLLFPLLAQGLVIDLLLLRSRREPWFYVAGAAAAIVVFLVSLPVFSVEHLTPLWLILTLLGRLLGAAGAVWASGILAKTLLTRSRRLSAR